MELSELEEVIQENYIYKNNRRRAIFKISEVLTKVFNGYLDLYEVFEDVDSFCEIKVKLFLAYMKYPEDEQKIKISKTTSILCNEEDFFNLDGRNKGKEPMDLLSSVANCIAEFYGKPLLSEGPKIMITPKDAKKIRTVLKKEFKKKK